MNNLYQTYFNTLQKNGVSLFMSFVSTGLYDQNQAWGVLEASDQNPLDSVKYSGTLKFIKEHSKCTDRDMYSLTKTNFSCTNDCSGSGVCVGDGKCECYYGVQGDHCQNSTYTEHVDMCGYKCTFDRGVCVPSQIIGVDRYWQCNCRDPYYGPQCSLFDCQKNCNYNGQCLDANTCKCYPGFKGDLCDIDCGCNGHGVCTADVSKNATCQCDQGYSWSFSTKRCEVSCRSDVKNKYSTIVMDSSQCNRPDEVVCSGCKFGSCVKNTCECWNGYSGIDCSIKVKKINEGSLVGMNLAGIAYYSSEWTFVDAFKMSSDWISLYKDGWTLSGTWGNGQQINLNSNGYPSFLLPGQILVKLLLRDIHLHAPAGRYVCLYDGDGEIDFKFDASVVSIGKGRVEFLFYPTQVVGCFDAYCSDNGILLRLLSTNPNNPVHNIRVIMPGFENSYIEQPFHPYFLQTIRHYSTLRFMDWIGTNNNIQQEWGDRTTPMNATYSTVIIII